MKYVVKTSEALKWESPDPDPNHRYMSLLFERDITPTKNIAAGIVTLPVGQEQQKLSVHEGEEIYFVLQGKGKFVLNNRIFDVEKYTGIYVAPGTKHRAINTGTEEMMLYFVNSPSVFGPIEGYKEFMKGWKQIS